jgi:hypothetical protein
VLEHNYKRKSILTAALRSFRKKLCLILFAPFSLTYEIGHNSVHGIDVPDLVQ